MKISNPLIPMGAITGDLSAERINEMLNRYYNVGIRQFLIYPRDGCDVPYMSVRWLEICEDIVKTAASLGMCVWLYDEFNWPSGTCGGKVMRDNPDFRAQRIVVRDGTAVIERSDFYSDILNPDAVDCFIENTHEVYYKHLGDYFGTVIKGIFTDEPSFSYAVKDSDGIPYTDGIAQLYKASTGRALTDDIKHPDGEFSKAYYVILKTLFRRNYVDRINSWCDAHGILLTGHLLSETNIESSIKCSGNTIFALRGFGLPGMDEIYTLTSLDSAELITLGCAQAAVRNGKNGGLAELFSLGPTDITPARVLRMIWFTALFGIDRYLLAVSASDARGNVKKNGWFNPMNYMQPWFEGYAELGEQAAKAAFYASKTIKPCVYVRYPAKKASEYLFDGKRRGLTVACLRNILKKLTEHQYQWQLLDEDEQAPTGYEVIEIDDVIGFNSESTVCALDVKYPGRTRVLDENGALPENVLLREYTDGSIIILDLRDADEPRRLTLYKGSEATPVLLPGGGAYIASEPGHTEYRTLSSVNPEFSLTLGNENTLRPNIRRDKTEYSFTVTDEIKDVSVSVRQYMYEGKVYLDGAEVNACRECKALVPGIRELYMSSDTFTLSPGTHTVSVSVPARSEPFLPSSFITGRFAADREDRLYKLPEKAGLGTLNESVLAEYAGMITYETDISIPSRDGLMFKLGCCGLYTRVYLDKTCLGGRLRDFIWDIPSCFYGKTVRLKIEQFTSAGPLFGRADDVICEGDGEKWTDIKKLFPGKYQKCGITGVEFII